MSDSEEENNGNNGNNGNSMSFDNPLRGYSRRHSYYDNAFNMDFEYSYLDLMRNFRTFVSRTQETYSTMETCISNIIETQNERRRSVNRRRERAHNNRIIREQQHLVANDNANDNDNDNDNDNPVLNDYRYVHNDDVVDNTINETIAHRTPVNQNNIDNRAARDAREAREMNNNNSTTGVGSTRRPLFDIGSVIYSIPRTVLLNPDANTNLNNTILNRRRRNGGLTISEIEENTEIVTYGSIPTNDILNTECPITRETFTNHSVVLTLKQCRHCFVPFRMMTWLETHSTCPLCRANVVRVETPQTNAATNNNNTNNNNTNNNNNTDNTENGTNIETNNTNNSDTPDNNDNLNISNIFNNLIQNSNNDFNNLSIDNLSDNSIVFSFDLPSAQANEQNSDNNPFSISQIERLMANTLSRNIFNRSTSTSGVTPNTNNTTNNTTNTTNTNNNSHDEDQHYPDVD